MTQTRWVIWIVLVMDETFRFWFISIQSASSADPKCPILGLNDIPDNIINQRLGIIRVMKKPRKGFRFSIKPI